MYNEFFELELNEAIELTIAYDWLNHHQDELNRFSEAPFFSMVCCILEDYCTAHDKDVVTMIDRMQTCMHEMNE